MALYCIPVCCNAFLVFLSISLYVVFFIICFVCSLFSIFLHAVFHAVCKVSLFHILILHLLLLSAVKSANVGHAEQRASTNGGCFCLEQ